VAKNAAMSDEELAAVIHNDSIDVLVDLAGHTGGNRLVAFSYKPAPVQCTYLGYPNTTGLDTVDYRITDGRGRPAGGRAILYGEAPQARRLLLCYSPPCDAPDACAHEAMAKRLCLARSIRSQS